MLKLDECITLMQKALNNTKANRDFCHNILNQNMKLEVDQLELSTLVASLGKSRHYFESVRKDQNTADWLQQIRIKLIKQGEKEGIFKDYLTPAK
jgi:hypothetical protein